MPAERNQSQTCQPGPVAASRSESLRKLSSERNRIARCANDSVQSRDLAFARNARNVLRHSHHAPRQAMRQPAQDQTQITHKKSGKREYMHNDNQPELSSRAE